MGMTLQGFVYDNSGNAIAGATVQGYESADNATAVAEASTTTDSNGKWAITTTDASHIPMDVKITYGTNHRWLKAGDKVNLTDMTVTGTLTVGEDAAGFNFALYSADSSGDGLTWVAADEVLQITGKNGATSLDVLDGDVRIVDKLYFYDRGGEYISSDGSTLTITGATSIGALSLSSMASNWTNAGRTVADMGIVTTIDINGGTIDGTTVGATGHSTIKGTTIDATTDFTIGATVITDGVITDASGLSLAADVTVTGDLTVSGDTITVNTATLTVEDPLIALATGNAGADTFDIGFYGLYDTSGSQDLYAGLFRDANDSGKWKLFKDNQAAPSATAVNTSGTGYAVGTLVATLEGNVTGALTGNADTATALATGRTIAMTGDVTWTSASFTGAGNVTGAGTIADNAVTLAKMAGIARGKIIYGDASGNPAVLASGTANQVLTMTDGNDFDWADSTVGDITSVVAGAGMTGGATTGDATLNVIGGDGIDVAADAVAVDLVANGGLEFASGELQVATGISQYDVAQFASGVANSDFLKIDGTTVVGRSAAEVLSDIGASAAAGSGSIVTTGALDTGSITSGFGAIAAGGIIKTEDTTNATSTTDGSLQTDGGLSVVLDAVFGDDVTLITDAAVLNLGIGSDVKLTHDGTTGGTLSGTPVTVDSLGASALADNNYTGLVLGFIAHEDMDVGQAVYIHTDDGEVGIADANALATMPAIGVVVGADASADDPVKILVQGIYNDSDGFGGALTEGATMYLGETTGAVTATIPDADGDFVQVMGVACGPRDVYINPSLDIIERAG